MYIGVCDKEISSQLYEDVPSHFGYNTFENLSESIDR